MNDQMPNTTQAFYLSSVKKKKKKKEGPGKVPILPLEKLYSGN